MEDIVEELFFIDYDDLSDDDFLSISTRLRGLGGTPDEILEPGNKEEEMLDSTRNAETGSENNLARYNIDGKNCLLA